MKKNFMIFLLCLVFFTNGQAQKNNKITEIDTLIDVGGYKLHFNIIKGKGVPILFEAGNGDNSTVWKDLLKPLHEATGATLITYDRAGLGLSSIDTTKINLTNEIKGLEIGLRKLGYFKDIFIVNHSFGSFYTTLFASRNSKKVKGAVFIDVLTPCFFNKARAKETMASVGKEDWAMIKSKAIGLYYVLANLENIYNLMKDVKFPSEIPATVIGADIPPKIVKENEQNEWKECLKSFGSLPNNQYILAKDCGHKVWKDNPTLVINEITKLYKKVQSKKK